ncbi:MAG: PD40 domain-containing protein [Bryobacteraceae bacterium]|nr:PD40 domain-containing protein [Bryobacteraceae bacterium]
MNKTNPIIYVVVLGAAAGLLHAQQSDITIKLTQGERAAIAVPDMRGAGASAPLGRFVNETLFSDLQESGLFRMVPKSMYPVEVPQRPQDFVAPQPAPRAGAPPIRKGPWLTDWSGPPANANYLTIGYAAEQGGRLVLFGWLYNVNQTDLANAQVFGKLYFGDLDEGGARKVAHDFAADILGQFGFKSLAGTKVYFVSDRTGAKEIWEMNHDGNSQRQLTRYGSTSTFPAVSPDGTKLLFTTYASGYPMIYLHSLETGRRLPFYNQRASMNATAEYTPDGQTVLFSSTAAGPFAQLYACKPDGTELRRLTHSNAIDVEPTVNPRTGSDIVFVSGRSGLPQIYRMNIDGADVVRLSSGEGEAVNPSWHPDGQHIAFSWTKGYDPGNYNVFVMDVTTREYVQLTHGAGRNENPCWAPDGRHIVFSSNRSGSTQIYTMLADGTQVKPLTTQRNNEKPVWSR